MLASIPPDCFFRTAFEMRNSFADFFTRLVDGRAWSDINPTGVTLFRFRNAAMKCPE
jgi:hypothetical protein